MFSNIVNSPILSISFSFGKELGDVIIRLNDNAIEQESDLFQFLELYQPGDTVKLVVNRVVAVENEIQMKQIELKIPLQSSKSIEKMFQLLP